MDKRGPVPCMWLKNGQADAPDGLCPPACSRSDSGAIPPSAQQVSLLFGPTTAGLLATLAETIGRNSARPPARFRGRDWAGPRGAAQFARDARRGRSPDAARNFSARSLGAAWGPCSKDATPDLGRDLAVKVAARCSPRPARTGSPIRRGSADHGPVATHPGIVPVYELGAFADQRPYPRHEARERAHSSPRSLADRKAAERRPAEVPGDLRARRPDGCLCHARGVIHRDLKPSNIMVGSFGEVQVMDWVLAKILTSRRRVGRARRPAESTASETVIATARSDFRFRPIAGRLVARYSLVHGARTWRAAKLTSSTSDCDCLRPRLHPLRDPHRPARFHRARLGRDPAQSREG